MIYNFNKKRYNQQNLKIILFRLYKNLTPLLIMLQKLEIKRKSKIYPQINFNPQEGIFEILGRSLPENATNFYDSVIDWVEEYAKEPNNKTVFTFKLDYYNSASARKITDIFIIVSKIRNVKILWYYMKDDEVMRENGEDFESIVNIPIEFIEW